MKAASKLPIHVVTWHRGRFNIQQGITLKQIALEQW
jgi:hypothetical protein